MNMHIHVYRNALNQSIRTYILYNIDNLYNMFCVYSKTHNKNSLLKMTTLCIRSEYSSMTVRLKTKL